jgi:hypothetical protein
LATFLVVRTRFAGVEKWQADRVTQIALEADRRRDEHRAEGAVALARLRARGESIPTIAKLANVSERLAPLRSNGGHRIWPTAAIARCNGRLG